MKKILPVFFLSLMLFSVFCSNPSKVKEQKIAVSFTIDDSLCVITDSFRIDFINGSDTLRGVADGNYLLLPRISMDTVYELVFRCSLYTLSFNDITKKMILPEQDVEWKFGIDNKPFNNLMGLLSYEDFKTDTITKRLEYLQFNMQEFGDGIQIVNKIK